jgi:hypothetical protein
MRAKDMRMLSVLVCVGLCWVGLPLRAQQQTGSVLSRVQTVEDPELGDLIRVAIENYRRMPVSRPPAERQQEELKIVQEVTESYARIKLLDEQIERTTRKAAEVTGEVRQEMFLARAELESKRMIELGKLRQIMGVIPAHAFGRRPVSELKTWLHLDVVGDRIVVSVSRQSMGYSPAGVMAKNTAVEYVAKQMKGESRLPIRIDIHRTVDGLPLSEQLESEITQLIKKSNLQMQAEIHLEEVHQAFYGRELFVEEGKVGRSRREPGNRPSYLNDIIEPNNLARTVESWIVGPKSVPAVFTISYIRGDEETADKVSQTVMETAKRLGLSEFVQVKRVLRQLKAEEMYLGRWEAKRDDGPVMGIIIEPNRSCVLIEGEEQTRSSWSLDGETLIVNSGPDKVRGTLDPQGCLVIVADGKKTTVDPQGQPVTVAEQKIVTFTRVK